MDPAALQHLIEDLLGTLGLSFTSVSVSAGPRVVAAVSSSESKDLIGPHGEHLQALNTVARRLVEVRHGEAAANFLIDVNGYHESRLQTLRENAKLLAQRARLFKHDVEMSPMSAYERLVIHELFAEDPEIETHSQGEGKMRHIVLKYKTKSESAL
jgi:spoIIIJ-associated protein